MLATLQAPRSDAPPAMTRLQTRGTVQATACLPRSSLLAGSFGGSLGSSSSSAAGSSSLDANPHVLYATSHGEGSEISLRSLLSEEQKERRRRAQREAIERAEDADAASSAANAAAAAAAFDMDPAPIVASAVLGASYGGVTKLACLSDRLAVASTEAGQAVLIEVGQGSGAGEQQLRSRQQQFKGAYIGASSSSSSSSALHLRPVHSFTGLHSAGSSATCLATQLSSSTPLVATGGSDGSLALLAPFTRQLLHRVPHAHPSSIYTTTFTTTSTVAVAGMSGYISSFDTRIGSGSGSSNAASSKPCQVLFDPNAVSLTSSVMHPTRSHLLAVGSSNGSLSLFDLRAGGTAASATPICSIQASRAAIWDLAFLPWQPSRLLAASEDGSVCCFDFGAGSAAAAAEELSATGVSGGEAAAFGVANQPDNAMFSSAAAERGMKPTKIVQNMSAVRSLSLDRDTRTLVCGTDAPCLITCTLAK